jgi:NADH:ubiquinone oxidoreductase subunit 5 (subunit L)/multisubunit Na+/H+ antiporter MnhA subunit/multisubunit Na+/H+ antiporter MnhB subunit
MPALIFIAIFFPLLISPLFFFLRRYIPRHLGFAAIFVSSISLVCVVLILAAGWKESQVASFSWMPALGINLTFIADGLSLFFGILVTAMGILVCWYSQYYMDPEDPHLGRFYACLAFFMGSMLGTVFSSNLLVLFIFWELTGIASFLLIGYWHPDPAAWKGARMALLVTAFSSLALFAGILLLGILTGTYEWHLISVQGIPFQEHLLWSYPIILCFLIGIFGKSAQFPFFFWLSNAMAAPTPVSAFLHSATMVKLGIFLTARMYPIFVSHELWQIMLIAFSSITLLLGAALSLLSNDLKAILAYATVSQLGFFLGFYGMGGVEGIEYDFVHILNHAFYKGSLFMLVGIVEHATGIRDVRRLGGLWNKMPLTTFIFFVAAAAMAGIPGTTGFLSKELFLTDILALGSRHYTGWIVLGVLIVASLFKVAFSIRIFFHLFVRDLEQEVRIKLMHTPSLAIQLPPLILSSAAFLFGIWPTGLEHLTNYFYVSGLHKFDPSVLQIWHGWTIEFLISFLILLGGTGVFLAAEKNGWRWTALTDQLNFGDFFEYFVNAFPKLSGKFIRRFEPSSYQGQTGILFCLFGLGLGGYYIVHFYSDFISFQVASISPVRFLIIMLIAIFTVLLPLFRQPVPQLLALSGAGFFIAILFTFYEAPDLAMTQILVEVITSLVILVFLRHLHGRHNGSGSGFSKGQILRVLLSVACGLTAAMIAALYRSPDKPLVDFFLSNSVPIARGSNVVNTILVDFRGLDTLGETTVVFVTMLGVAGLLMNKRILFFKSVEPQVPLNSGILQSIMPLVFVLVSIFSVYLLLRGHDYPGGGFIAGVASGIALVIFGLTAQLFKQPAFFINLGFCGLSMILIAGLVPVLIGHTFLTHYAAFAVWPPLESLTALTPLIFDIGIYLVVLAMTTATYFLFRRSHLGAEWS